MLHALTIGVSAFLLFLVQPLIAKQIVPWFGGSAATWTVCLLFFQLVLLAGYTYADLLSRITLRRQAIVHTVLVLLACLTLPIIPDASWKPAGQEDPTWRILLLLGATIGLPYLAVSTTGPLVQSWFARLHADAAGAARPPRVYRLFALSNLASLVALVAYPFALEPFATVKAQSWGWSVGFVLFAGLVIAAAWTTEARLRARGPVPDAEAPPLLQAAAPVTVSARAPRLADMALWLTLSALGTVMLLAVSAHITHDVASVPFLWIVPLALYLLTFILCFDSDFWYRRRIFWPAVAVLAPAMAWAMRVDLGLLPIRQAVPLFSIGLFAVCMFCHGELVRARPAPAHLTRFYLMISVGGAVGGILVGLVAPRVFDGYWELPIALVASCLMLAFLARGLAPVALTLLCAALLTGFAWLAGVVVHVPPRETVLGMLSLAALLVAAVVWRRASARVGAGLMAGVALACCVVFGWSYVDFIRGQSVVAARNFYGMLRVKRMTGPGGADPAYMLVHGLVSHGHQYLEAPRRGQPASYYGPNSGAGLVLANPGGKPQRIGVAGLGIGTAAVFGKAGGTMRFYEINPLVLEVARSHFSYLADSKSKVETELGDARLVLERELAHGSQQFDVLFLDAFSSDSVPVHLLTREALALYRQHLAADGLLVFNISNRYLNLAPVVAQLAADAGMRAVLVEDSPTERVPFEPTAYMLVSGNNALLDDPRIASRAKPVEQIPNLRVWTDDYNNLFRILR